jgi:DNA invertase Pin-like site-specific DNA recombinase
MSVNFNGKSISQIARELGCSRYKAKKIIHNFVFTTSSKIYLDSSNGLYGSDIDNIFEMRKKGIAVIEIAEKYDVTRDCIYKILRKYRG